MKLTHTLTTLAIPFLLIGFATSAEAYFPAVTIDRVEQVPVVPDADTEIEVPGFPYQLNFYGTVTHVGHGNLNRVELSATINDEIIYGPERLNGLGNQTTTTYVIPWIVERPGSYALAITALHPDKQTNSNGCKAAPAIANAYIKENELKNKPNTAIKNIASETGKNGELWAKDSCSGTYETRTIEMTIAAFEAIE